jgi:hypothetical protein
VRISAEKFQPFPSRAGVDTVVGLRFKYDADLIDMLKALLQLARVRTGGKAAGGWLKREKRWFVEWAAWPFVQEALEADGHTIVWAVPVPDGHRPTPDELDWTDW